MCNHSQCILYVRSSRNPLSNMQGIVADSYVFLEDPDLIKVVKERSIVLFSWGDTNNDSVVVKMQANAGVDAVICDW